MGRARSVPTTPKLVCLPIGPGKLHRNSFFCQKARGPAYVTRQGERSSRATNIERGSRGGGGSDQAWSTPPAALSVSAPAMMRRAGRSEKGAAQTETCTSRSFASFACFRKLCKGWFSMGCAQLQVSFASRNSPSHAKSRRSVTITPGSLTGCADQARSYTPTAS